MATLFIHIGHGKTGSSWIQTSLRLSRDALLQNGILYARGEDMNFDHPGRITSGNGSNLLKSKASLVDHLKKNQAPNPTSLLFSSEHIFADFIDYSAEEYLEETAGLYGFDKIKILLFIRDPIGMASSIWQQRTKRRGDYTVTLDNLHEHLEIGGDMVMYVEDLLNRLKKCRLIELTIRNYSRCRERLTEETANWLGVPASVFTVPEIRRVNRSLTWPELYFQNNLNRVIGPSGNIFSDPLCEKLPDLKYEPILPPVAVQKAIWMKLQPYIERVNAQIPELHRYHCDIQAPLPIPGQLTFSTEQINIISDSIGNEILRLRNPHIALTTPSGILVTVIIPNFNYGRYLEQCIQSVLDSDFDPWKLEILLVDDASTDNSLDIARRWMNEKKCNFRIIANTVNLGVIRCRNIGIINAAGEFIYFLDADNYLHKECLRSASEMLMQNQDVSACFAPVREFRSETGEYEGVRSDMPFNYQHLLEMPYIDAMAMFRKRDLVDIGMYDTRMPPYGWEDYELWLRMGQQGRKVAFLPGKPLSFYRVHELNKSQHYLPDHYNQLVYYLRQKYGIKVSCLPTETLERLVHPEKDSVHLYYATPESDFSEKNSLVLEADSGNFLFRLPARLMIQRLRLDPCNYSTVIKFSNLQFFHLGEEQLLFFKVSSNAIKISGTTWYFNERDPQIIIEFENAVSIDEIHANIEYLTMGGDVVEEMKQHFNRNAVQISELEKSGVSIKRQLVVKDAAYRFFKQSVFQKQFTGLAGKIRLRRMENRVIHSGFFNADFYLQTQPDVRLSGLNPVQHFLLHGGFEGRSPSEKFDTDWYLNNYPDVDASGANPLLHYLEYGRQEGRSPKNTHPCKDGRPSSGIKKVSVIMTAFNGQTTIEFALESLLKQTYRDLEIIVVDDASKDNTVQLVEKMAAVDSRIVLIRRQENSGPYTARNQGIIKATGDYITFHDADDIALPDRIESQLFRLLTRNVQFVIPGFMRTKLTIHQLSKIHPDALEEELKEHKKQSGLQSNIYYELRPCLSMTMFTREIFSKHGLYWTTRFAGDAEFVERILKIELGITFNDQKGELRSFIQNESSSERLYSFVNRPLILSPEKSAENVTVQFPMGGLEREQFKQIWKKRLIGIGDYVYPQL
jgi:glycosyltransferase involved in cell wall biosynthesis